MASGKSKPRKKNKKCLVELSLSSLLFWGGGLFFFLACIFVLGIFVGQGFLPEKLRSLTGIKTEVTRDHNKASNQNLSEFKGIKKADNDPKFAFYDELSTKKEEAAKKNSRRQKKKNATPARRQKRVVPPETGVTYTLQLASLEDKAKADKLVSRLKKQGYPAFFYQADVKGKTYYRIRCGNFKNKNEAERFKALLAKKEKMEGLIVKIDN